MLPVIKSGVRAAFFCLLSLGPINANADIAPVQNTATLVARLQQAAQERHLDQDRVWIALLHESNGRSLIQDPGFLLSLPEFSAEQELQKTIAFLYGGPASNVCRFPARYLWIRQQLDAPALAIDDCPDLSLFRKNVPPDQISLVFASENLAQPSSMLGHAFIKISGNNGHAVSYAISFYTDVETYNLPKLLYDSTVRGMQGYFSLAPYPETLERYVDQEGRIVWEYPLNLTSWQRTLISFHLIELKQTQLTYYFQKYNCATVVNFILALSGQPMPDNTWWLTPKDVVKNAHRAGIIDSSQIVAPSRWIVRAVEAQVPAAEQDSVRAQVLQGNAGAQIEPDGATPAYLRLQLAKTYNQYAYDNKLIPSSLWQQNAAALSRLENQSFADMRLNLNPQYNPIYSPGERQLSAAVRHEGHQSSILLSVLPVSHTLDDDNRNATSESGLQLFGGTIKIDKDGRPSVDQFTLYGMQSLMPYDRLTGGLSGGLRIGLEQQRDQILDTHRAISISGNIGLTGRPVEDIDIYTLAGGGAANAAGLDYLYTTAEIGAMVREFWDMKTRVSLVRTDHQMDSGSHYYTLELNQAKYLNPAWTLDLDWQHIQNKQKVVNSETLTLKNLF